MQSSNLRGSVGFTRVISSNRGDGIRILIQVGACGGAGGSTVKVQKGFQIPYLDISVSCATRGDHVRLSWMPVQSYGIPRMSGQFDQCSGGNMSIVSDETAGRRH